nr:STY0301 family protein [Cronobacter malonaticus]
MEIITMLWSKTLLLSAGLFLSVTGAQATVTLCPQYPTAQDKTHVLDDASLFVGPPEGLVDLMPDNDSDTVWTLPDYQDEAKKSKTSLYFVCLYKNTKQTVNLIVPATAKKCSVAYDKNSKLIAACE